MLPFDGVLPAKIGRYEVLGQLAAGGMAEILLARLSGPGDFKRAVVIKRILRAYAANTSFVRMFLDEARIVASLRHPNVVHVQELGEHDGEVFLVMEYVAGENAASLLKGITRSGESLDPRLVAHLVAEACAGLHAAHELTGDDGQPQNLVHRDVSPQNLLVGYDGHVKLVDFGIARVDQRDALTEPGEVKGKFEYMSPEQARGQPLDRRSDLFSLGIVLYELSTGRRLFKRTSIAKTIEAICREPIVPPSRAIAAGATYPSKLEAIVMRALAKDPAMRYANAAEMRLELLEVAHELASPVEALAEKMRRLFPERIAEKEELLRKVGEGEGLSHVPAGETDESVDVPMAPDATAIATDPRLASASARRWRRVAFVTAATAVVVVAALVIVGRARSTMTASPVPAQASAAPNEKAPDRVVVHVETKPEGARVTAAGEYRGESPIEVVLPRGHAPVTLELSRQGFVTVAQEIVPDSDQKVLVGLTPVVVRGRPAARPVKPRTPATTSSVGFRRFD